MLRLGCIEMKEKGKTGGAGGPERATAHFGSFVMTEKFMSRQGFSSPTYRQGLPCRARRMTRPGRARQACACDWDACATTQRVTAQRALMTKLSGSMSR